MSRSLFIPRGVQRKRKTATRTRMLRAETLEPRQMLSVNEFGLFLGGKVSASQAPTVAKAAAAASSSVTGDQTVLSVLGADAGGAASLTYSWSTTSEPKGAPAPTFSANGTNAAQDTTVTFDEAGTYTLAAKITAAAGLSVTSGVKVVVKQTLSKISVTPGSVSLHAGAKQQFATVGLDQFGNPLTSAPNVAWSTTAGTITGKGLLTVPKSGKSLTVTATDGSIKGAATVTIIAGPTVATAAAATPSPVTGVSTVLSVLGADSGGTSSLVYTWTATLLPGGVPPPTFSANGTNAARNTTVTFDAAGSYTFVATVTDLGGLSATSSVTVVVHQTLTRIDVAPSEIAVSPGGTQQFAASGVDQFGNAMAGVPTITWSTTAGTISNTGLLTAPTSGKSLTVTAADGSIKGATLVMIVTGPSVATAAAATPGTVAGTSTALTVLGADSGERVEPRVYVVVAQQPGTGDLQRQRQQCRPECHGHFLQGRLLYVSRHHHGPRRAFGHEQRHGCRRPDADPDRREPALRDASAGGTQQFTATRLDQFGNAMGGVANVTWSTTAGSITPGGLLTAPLSSPSFTVTAADGTINGTAGMTVSPPWVVATPSPVTGVSTALSVLGTGGGGDSNLVYAWTTTSLPGGAPPPTFSVNGSSAALNTTVTFHEAGCYTFVATTALGGSSITSSVTVVVDQTLTGIGVAPAEVWVGPGGTQQFTATELDQFGNTMAGVPNVIWSTTAGSITAEGLLTAPNSGPGFIVTAGSGGLSSGSASAALDTPPTVAQAAAATSSLLTGVSTDLSVLGADLLGESTLVYTWSTTSLPGGAPSPTFSVNGTNAAQDTTVAFSKAGSYTLLATITDLAGFSVATSVMVVVNQTLTRIDVAPFKIVVGPGGTQQFAATGFDQFGNAMAVAPSISWSATAGSISSSGLLTAPNADGSMTVTAASGGVQGTAAIAVGTGNFLNLQDAALAQLVQSLDAGGSISRDDMLEILDSLATGGTLSVADFSDLQTIVSDAAELNMPDYVRVLASDVVDGNVANATYQGEPLGNLAAGSSSAQLTDLIGKWFLGTDLPVADAYDSYNNGQPWSYAMASGSLFVGTPSHNDEDQGLLGDCYFVSALGSLADASPAAVENMFIDNGDNTWTVRFYDNGTADYVTVNRMLPFTGCGVFVYADSGYLLSNPNNVLWIALAEKAYAEWNQTGNEGRPNGNNCYSSINGGGMDTVYAQVLGYPATDYQNGLTAAQDEAALVSAMTNNWAVSIGTDISPTLAYGLVEDHVYAIIGYDSTDGTFTLYNPWGYDQPTSPLTWSELQSTCDEVCVANASGSVPISSGVGAAAAGYVEMSWQNNSTSQSARNLAADAYFRDFYTTTR